MNKARLRVLQARDTVLDEILEEARRQLRETSGSAPQYEELMRGLILQVLFAGGGWDGRLSIRGGVVIL